MNLIVDVTAVTPPPTATRCRNAQYGWGWIVIGPLTLDFKTVDEVRILIAELQSILPEAKEGEDTP